MKKLKIQGSGNSLFFVYRHRTIAIPQNARILNIFGKAPPRVMDNGIEKKYCPKCNKWVSARCFHRNKCAPDGLYSSCADCHARYLREWRLKRS
jgi:hypothetical protein